MGKRKGNIPFGGTMEDVTELGLTETRWEGMEWIHVARDWKQRRGLVKTGSYDAGTVLA